MPKAAFPFSLPEGNEASRLSAHNSVFWARTEQNELLRKSRRSREGRGLEQEISYNNNNSSSNSNNNNNNNNIVSQFVFLFTLRALQ